MEESDHTTRMGTLRRELEQERVERTTLENKVAELQQVIEELQLLKSKSQSEEDGSEDESPPSLEDLRAADGKPSDLEGLPHLISLYGSALHDSKNIQKCPWKSRRSSRAPNSKTARMRSHIGIGTYYVGARLMRSTARRSSLYGLSTKRSAARQRLWCKT